MEVVSRPRGAEGRGHLGQPGQPGPPSSLCPPGRSVQTTGPSPRPPDQPGHPWGLCNFLASGRGVVRAFLPRVRVCREGVTRLKASTPLEL